MKQVFDVKGITCGHCVRAVTEALKDVDPIAVVEVDLNAGTVSVDSQRPVDTLATAIREAGYEVASP
ncbi:MAG TPA: heavy-metal-associated domain-containing protein [Burkholderiaceae bacterium]|nr:heavy-metal-associated domain-containing protein [Burkholderiaceae bacterium]